MLQALPLDESAAGCWRLLLHRNLPRFLTGGGQIRRHATSVGMTIVAGFIEMALSLAWGGCAPSVHRSRWPCRVFIGATIALERVAAAFTGTAGDTTLKEWW